MRPDPSGHLAIEARRGTKQFLPGRATPTAGYDGAFLGPALRVRRGTTVHVEVANRLPVPTSLHWHGLIVPGDVDGGPHSPIAPGGSARPSLAIEQPAATLWFHPHLYPTTATQVTDGLSGLLIVDDDDTDALGLPSHWGVDDIPLIVQDRRFLPDGRFFDRLNLTAITYGYVGDVPLVNGAHDPVAHTARGWLRLRVLDASNARSYRLAASDGRTLHVIGSDGGLLASPVPVPELEIHAAERFELMVDCRDGRPFDLLTLPVGQAIMRLPPFDAPTRLLTIVPDATEGRGRLPDRLAPVPSLPATLPPVDQHLVMDMFRDRDGMMPIMRAGLAASGPSAAAAVGRATHAITAPPPLPIAERLSSNGINGRPFGLHLVPIAAARATPLRWRIGEGSDAMPHPVHLHGCQFRIVSDNGVAPPAWRAGWKDVAPIDDGGWTEILVQFPCRAGPDTPYMAHCHILEHEDSGMMTQFTVS